MSAEAYGLDSQHAQSLISKKKKKISARKRACLSDIVLGLLKKIQKKREDLRVIVASATLDAENFHKFFNRCGENQRGSVFIFRKQTRQVLVRLRKRKFTVLNNRGRDPFPLCHGKYRW